MRATRLASTSAATALSFAALTCALAPTAAADGDNTTRVGGAYGFTVTPPTVAAGSQVTLTAAGCPGAATIASGAFDTVLVPAGRPGRATVGWNAKPGAQYDVAFTCNGAKGSAPLTVAAATNEPTTSSTSLPPRPPAPAPTRSPSPSVSPTATATAPPSPATSASPARGVRGGTGGSIGSMDSAEVAGGAGLVLLAAGGSYFALRRRAAARRPH
ncbi:hypothetical protein ACIQM4_29730 [Streptomyces sp. NPDC091272]|uniref:hypothetical protein n=1 Tax=Streptomyces sp. NPDC091272 TaxID=3365981 RepID=UPI00382A3F7A